MKQILQDLATGKTEFIEAPMPISKSNHVIINSTKSLISLGTEKMLVDFGKANILQKARQQPEKVKEVLIKTKTDGIISTFDAVRSKLGNPIPLGYSNVGVIESIGEGVSGFKTGDRVVSNGPHADVVRIPKNLIALVPNTVTDEQASFTVVASIGLQGVRLAKPTLGEYFVVMGVGLIGLLTVQILIAQGCRVLAVDLDKEKLKLAESFGAETCNIGNNEDPISVGMMLSDGIGMDGVIITASAKSDEIVDNASKMLRQRGRIVLVGVVGLNLKRSSFYEKEITFQVSCSYGPGRYDQSYEEGGNDYPIGYVRWTEQRNFSAVLNLLAAGTLNIAPLISHRYKFSDSIEAYGKVLEEKGALGIVLDYDLDYTARHNKTISLRPNINSNNGKINIGFIGAGNYGSRVLIPAFKKTEAGLHTISSSGGVNGSIHGRKNGFLRATSDTDTLISDTDVNTLVVATRHNSHAKWVIKGLKAGKNIFVEKPLALNLDDLSEIEKAYNANNSHLMVGFNRRFSSLTKIAKKLLKNIKEPKSFMMVMNAGKIPDDHWTQNDEIGGGRILGEACHHIDLMRFLAGSPITSFNVHCMGAKSEVCKVSDNAVITLSFLDGSYGTIHYLPNGSALFPKERVEIFVAGQVLQLNNFINLKGYGWPGFRSKKLLKQDKGQAQCTSAFVKAILNDEMTPIPASELFEVSRVAIKIAEQLKEQS